MVLQDGGRPVLPTLQTTGTQVSSPTANAADERKSADSKRRSPVPSGAISGRILFPLQLRNWRVRWRLLALVILPTVAAIVLGAVRIQAAQSTAANFARLEQLAVLGNSVTTLANSIEDERDLTAGFIGTTESGNAKAATTLLGQLNRQYAQTAARLTTVSRQAAQIGPEFPAVARTDLSVALSRVSALPSLRGLAHSQISPQPIIADYSNVIFTLIAFDNEIAAGTSTAQLTQTVSSLGALAQMADQASQQRAILYAALLQGRFGLGGLQALTTAQANEASDQALFQTGAANVPAYIPASGATPAGLSPALSEVQQFNDTVAGPGVDAAEAIEQNAIISGNSGGLPTGSAQAWFADISATLNDIRAVESNVLASVTAQANSQHQSSETSEQVTAIIVVVLLLLVLAVAIIVARSMTVPLRRLRTDALDVAGHRLPDMVRRMSENQSTDQSVTVEPISINSTDEIGEVAKAFDRVHREAVRLAGDEARLRANMNAMFVNLSRRSQTLIERQLGIIDSLEQSEQDPDRLDSLFRLDHLATRMRRNSENLLVLAGHDAPRKWSQPVTLLDVLRAATSEIEQYDRIELNVQPGVVVTGRAASDVVHLVAELAENATAFSPKVTQVLVTGRAVTTGGVLLEITDRGLGITHQDLDYANWRLDNPPVVDVAVSRRMGLFVVGRLAARHGIRVRLQHAPGGGLCALIWLPDAVAETEITTPLGFLRRRFDADRYLPAMQEASPQAEERTRIPAAQHEPAQPVPAPAIASVSSGTPEWRLPIYDSVESDWFRRSGKPFRADSHAADAWTSPADDGFQAAQVAISPLTGDMTAAGLPRRVPSANLVPGSVGRRAGQAGSVGPAEPQHSQGPDVSVHERTAEEVRRRMTGFQRGGRTGRETAPVSYWTQER